jgi:hypothetical protein
MTLRLRSRRSRTCTEHITNRSLVKAYGPMLPGTLARNGAALLPEKKASIKFSVCKGWALRSLLGIVAEVIFGYAAECRRDGRHQRIEEHSTASDLPLNFHPVAIGVSNDVI